MSLLSEPQCKILELFETIGPDATCKFSLESSRASWLTTQRELTQIHVLLRHRKLRKLRNFQKVLNFVFCVVANLVANPLSMGLKLRKTWNPEKLLFNDRFKILSLHNVITYLQHKYHSFPTNIYILLVSRQQLIGNFVISNSWNCIQSIDILVHELDDR